MLGVTRSDCAARDAADSARPPPRPVPPAPRCHLSRRQLAGAAAALGGHPRTRRPPARVGRLADPRLGGGELVGQAGDARRRFVPLIGAGPDEVLVGDSTSINTFKVAVAALRLRPDRRAIVTDRNNFPTDLYMIGSAAELCGQLEVRVVYDPEGVVGAARRFCRVYRAHARRLPHGAPVPDGRGDPGDARRRRPRDLGPRPQRRCRPAARRLRRRLRGRLHVQVPERWPGRTGVPLCRVASSTACCDSRSSAGMVTRGPSGSNPPTKPRPECGSSPAARHPSSPSRRSREASRCGTRRPRCPLREGPRPVRTPHRSASNRASCPGSSSSPRHATRCSGEVTSRSVIARRGPSSSPSRSAASSATSANRTSSGWGSRPSICASSTSGTRPTRSVRFSPQVSSILRPELDALRVRAAPRNAR